MSTRIFSLQVPATCLAAAGPLLCLDHLVQRGVKIQVIANVPDTKDYKVVDICIFMLAFLPGSDLVYCLESGPMGYRDPDRPHLEGAVCFGLEGARHHWPGE